ncbi:hypothetical protein ACSSQJ_003846 [Klebsiella aerogenes]|uniref:hypothetical protein n=1 Tax=Klebsiella aerogenes TaxID=548 RepID=UPI0018689036|nr:hypothetical protein [Klebsiella aerogenes]
MNCSDNVSSDAVLPEENISSSCQTGMGHAHIKHLLPMMKWNNDDFIIIYDPAVAFRNATSEEMIISLSCEYAREQK